MFLRKLCGNNIFSAHNRNNRNISTRRDPSSLVTSLSLSSSLSTSVSTSRIITTNSQQRQNSPSESSNNHQQNHLIQPTATTPPPPPLPPSHLQYQEEINYQERVLQAPSPPPSYSVHCPPSASVSNHLYSPQQQQQQQQQHYQNGYTASESSDESDTDERFRQTSTLRGAYCPDLLHACSLILPSSQRETEDDDSISTINQNILRRSLSFSSLDYAEIDDICQQFSQISSSNEASNSTQEYQKYNNGIINNHNNNKCISTIDTSGSNNNEQKGCISGSITGGQAMGQNLSLRRPRISMTWVLREQQQSNGTLQADNKNGNNNDKKKFKTKNKEDKIISEKLVNNNHNHNLQEYQEKREPCKDLFFVCSPQKRPIESHSNEILLRRRNEIRKSSERRSLNKVANSTLEKYEITTNDDLKSLKGTYSEPSLIAASEGNPRRHRHRKRRDRNRLQKFGYEIRNVDEFLSKCSLSSPGNIPVVLSSSSTLYQTRPGGYQIEIPLPLGMVVNAVFKNQNWLYVQTPHAEEGYVGYASCLPLGILPPAARTKSTSRPTPCWETNGDVFPKPSGNMTDSEKEVRLRGGTRSDGARTPRPRRLSSNKNYGEHHVDKLYLRAASQPRLTEKSYAQLRPTAMCRQHHSSSSASATTKPTTAIPIKTNDDYIVLKKQNSRTSSSTPSIKKSCSNNANMGTKTKSLRQTLVAITNDYVTDSITVRKGEIVTLLNCKQTKDKRQWFYIKTRDGREGFVPAEFAGHGFL